MTGTSTCLFDGNVLLALANTDHVHHHVAWSWRRATPSPAFATCPITEGTLVRISVRNGTPPAAALALLAAFRQAAAHEFWPDDLSYADVDLDGVIGHRQVTDAYLASLARAHGGRLATFDGGLAALYPDIAELVPLA